MTDRQNTTSYEHPQETNLLNLHKSMEYNSFGQPILRVTTSPGQGTTAGIDAFGRAQVAQPFTLFDSQHRYAENDRFWTSTVNGATTAHDADASLMNMNVSTTSGSKVIMESRKVFPYQPGKALEIFATFTMAPAQTNLRQRIGYFGSENGVFIEKDGDTVYMVLRSSSSGSIVETRVAQEDWNVDKADGTGFSMINLDFDKSQIFFTDIEWLGVGTVRTGFVVNGAFIVVHKFHHANSITGTYMTTAALPVRYEIEATGALSAPATLKHICSTVVSSGGYSLSGKSYTAGRGLSYYTASTAGTYYHLVSIRLKATNLDDIVIPNMINVLTNSNQNLQYELVTDATFATPLVWTDDDATQYSITNSVVSSKGTELLTGYIVNKGEAGKFTREQLYELQLQRANGVATVLSLIATADNNNTTMTGNMGWFQPLRG